MDIHNLVFDIFRQNSNLKLLNGKEIHKYAFPMVRVDGKLLKECFNMYDEKIFDGVLQKICKFEFYVIEDIDIDKFKIIHDPDLNIMYVLVYSHFVNNPFGKEYKKLSPLYYEMFKNISHNVINVVICLQYLMVWILTILFGFVDESIQYEDLPLCILNRFFYSFLDESAQIRNICPLFSMKNYYEKCYQKKKITQKEIKIMKNTPFLSIRV